MKFLIILSILLATSSSHPNVRIIGGQAAQPGQFPFSASIRTRTEDGRYFCGGALISDQHILTAAQCIKSGVEFEIQLGSISLNSTDSNRLTLTSNTSFIHEEYSVVTLENDIGLIKLKEPVPVNDRVKPIELPTADLKKGTEGDIIGWGQTNDMISGPVDLLNFVEVVTLDNTVCRLSHGDVVTDSVVCIIGNYNEGICIGDYGSPLVTYKEDGTPIHSGIAIFFSGAGCESTDPSGFERTFAYIDWINENMQK